MSEKMEDQQTSSGSSKSSNIEEREKKIAEIDKLLSEGKKFELVQSYEEAVDKFELATTKATEFFGDFAPECYLPALNFGKMLTQIARIESVNKPFTQKLGLDNTANENEDEADKVDMSENKELNKDKQCEEIDKKEEDVINKEKEEINYQQDDNNETMKTENEKEEENTEEDDEDMDDDNENDLAWDWLEVARKICEKQEQTNYWLERKSDAMFALGEFLTVVEEFDQAITEFENVLYIRQKIFVPSDRRIAEVLYMMGLTYANKDDFTKAAEYFERAKNVLENTIEDRGKDLTVEESKENQELALKLKAEIVELKSLVSAITERTIDSKESAESRARQLAAAANIIGKQFNFLNVERQGEVTEVTDVTALLQHKTPKKRPAEAGKENKVEEKIKLAKIEE